MDSPEDHPHPHAHAPLASAPEDAPPGYYDIMETAVRELLVEKKLIGPGEIRRQLEVLDSRTPALGGRGVESLAAEIVGQLTYYERWIVAFANILFQQGILTPCDLAAKMEEVTARHASSSQE